MKIYLIGYMGSGKSTLGRLLAASLNLLFLDMDDEFEARFKISINDFFTKYGEDAFRKIEHKLLIDILLIQDAIISTGGGTPCFFNNMDLMNGNGLTIYLKTGPGLLLQRLAASPRRRPVIQLMEGGFSIEKLTEHLASREKYYLSANKVVQSANPDVEEIKAMVLRQVRPIGE